MQQLGVQRQWHFVNRVFDITFLDHRLFGNTAEHGQLATHIAVERSLGSANQHLGLQTDLAELRQAAAHVGRRDFDTQHVGFATKPDDDGDDDGFWLDTSKPGNLNSGHAFTADAATWARYQQDPVKNHLPEGVIGPEFTDAQRYDIIEYLKVHRDPETPANYQPPLCTLAGEAL